MPTKAELEQQTQVLGQLITQQQFTMNEQNRLLIHYELTINILTERLMEARRNA
tara:strand:+ start:1375 stop:1536 length:162 start_codon:yes stop_codon:yes gene_type:complete